jgi:hypothetical protein
MESKDLGMRKDKSAEFFVFYGKNKKNKKIGWRVR